VLIQANKAELGDGRLNPEEGLAKLKEENASLAAANKIAAQDELQKAERAWGPQISYREIVRRIQNLNPKIKVVDGSKGNIAIYVLKSNQELAESAQEMASDKEHFSWWKDHKYVTGCPKDSLPEYGFVIADERGLAKREKRGWRSVLIALIKAKAISYQQSVEAFGEALGSRSNLWHAQLQKFRR
jgi:hypothetical protein